MKKILGLLLILILNLAAVQAVVPGAAHAGRHKKAGAAATAEVPMLSFKQSDCRKIEGQPTIVVCVEGDAGEGEFDLNTLRSLKGVTSNLITKYKAKSIAKKAAGVRKTSVTDTCGPMPDMAMDPGGYMTWMMCSANSANNPPDPCAGSAGVTNPMCPNYDPCAGASAMMNPMCPGYVNPTPDPCAGSAGVTNPMCPNYDPCAGASAMMNPMCPGYVNPTPDPCAGSAGVTNPMCPNYDPCAGAAAMMNPMCPGYVNPTPDPCAGSAGVTNPMCPNYDPCAGAAAMMNPMCPGYMGP